MDAFGVGIFSQLAQMRAQRVSQGLPVVDLSVGAPNIAPAPHIMQALSREALVPENYLYALGDTQALREAVAAWYLRRYGVTLDPASEIVSLLGSQEGLAHIALSIVDPGDVVLVPDPCYPIFADGPRLAGASLYPMPQRAENGYLIDLDELRESGLLVTPGSAFGALGKGHVRMALVQENDAVQGALETLRQSGFLSSGEDR